MTYIIIVITGIILIATAGYLVWKINFNTVYHFKDSKFSFDYPKLEGWEVRVVEDNITYRKKKSPQITLETTEAYPYSFHTISWTLMNDYTPIGDSKTINPNRVTVYEENEKKMLFNLGSNRLIQFEIDGFPEDNIKKIYDTIFKSFKENSIEKNIEASMPKTTNVKMYIAKDDSFAFLYSDFEKWTGLLDLDNDATQDEIRDGKTVVSVISYNPPQSEIWSGQTPEIKITRVWKPIKSLMGEPNPKGVYYKMVSLDKRLVFQSPDFEVTIEITAGEVEGFSSKVVLDEIIKTFELRFEEPIADPKKNK